MKLIVGLGNPGEDYADTRHNAGFWLVDRLATAGNATLRPESRFHGKAARCTLHGQEIWLLQPQTYMNRSGQAVGALAKFFKIPPDQILVAHDELDMPPGAIKLKRGGGSGGHNGLKDIAAHLGTQDFWRLRIGIGHPRNLRPQGAPTPERDEVANYVLKAPRREEQQGIDSALDKAVQILPWILRDEMEAAMMRLHAKD